MESLLPQVGLFINMQDIITTVAAGVLTTLILAVAVFMASIKGKLGVLEQILKNQDRRSEEVALAQAQRLEDFAREWDRRFAELTKDVEDLKAIVERGREWRGAITTKGE